MTPSDAVSDARTLTAEIWLAYISLWLRRFGLRRHRSTAGSGGRGDGGGGGGGGRGGLSPKSRT